MASVPTRSCGPAGLSIPAMSIGSWHTWDRAVFEDVVTLLRRTQEVGMTMFDVGVYRAGFDGDTVHDSPTDIVFARAVQAAGLRREDYLLSVKGWHEPTARGRTVTQQVQETLRRHGTDHADFLVFESIDYAPDFRLEAAIGEALALVKAGRVRHWAVNNWSASQIRAAQAEAERQGLEQPQYAQMIYGLGRRTIPEGEPITTLCEETGLSLQASDIFDGGVLLGKGSERHVAGDPGGVREAMRAAFPRLGEVAASLGATPAQFGFALPLTNPHTANVLVGVRTPEQFEDLLGAFDLLERVGAERLRAAADEFWFDRGRMDPNVGGQ